MKKGHRKGPRAIRSIFARIWLRPEQVRTVAERRFEDADCLRKTGKNARANGVWYLGGLVVECLLKARLLEKFTWLQSVRDPAGRSQIEKDLWSLCYRSHDLDEIREKLPEVDEILSAAEKQGRQRLSQSLKSICAEWTIFVRYSPQSSEMRHASQFLDQVKELKRWLR